MGIVLKWNFKNLLADIPRLVLTLLSVAGAFSMLTATGVTMESHMLALASINNGLSRFTVLFLQIVTLILFAFTMYLLFSISIEERRAPYALLRSAGATSRQTVWSLLAEAFTLDLAGAAVGIGAGLVLSSLTLQADGLTLRGDAIFHVPVFLYGLLPALLIPPAMMLLSAPRLFREPGEKKRRKGSKKDKGPFRKSVFSRLFGFGGALEHTLGKHQFRRRTRLTVVLMVNLAALVLVTAGFSVIEHTTERWEPYGEIELCYFHGTYFSGETGTQPDETHTKNSEAFHQAVRNMLQQCEKEGLARDVTFVSDCGGALTRLRLDDLNPVVAGARQVPYDYHGSYPVLYPDLLHVTEKDGLIYSDLFLMDDAAFDRLMKEYGIPYAGEGAVLCNACYYCETPSDYYDHTTVPLLRRIPAKSVTVYCPGRRHTELYELLTRYGQHGAQVFTVSDRFRSLLNDCPSAALKIEGLMPVDFDYAFNGVQGNFSYNGAILAPERLRDALPITKTDGTTEYVQLRTDDSETVAERLRALDGQYGYTVSFAAFSDGTYRHVYNSDGLTVIDHPSQDNQFADYLHYTGSVYQMFIVLCLLMIALNVVNVVHMNRVSRRREHAILTSIGISPAQRRGMLFYESCRITLRAVLFSAVLLLPAAWFGGLKLDGVLIYENRKMAGVEWITDGADNTVLNNIWITVKDLAVALKPYLWVVILAVLFLFFGFVAAELLVQRRFEKDELITVLKDDLNG